MGGRLYNLNANHTLNSDFDRTFMPSLVCFLFAAEQRVGEPNNVNWFSNVSFPLVNLLSEANWSKSVGLPIARSKLGRL